MFWPSRSSTGDESDVGAAPIADSGATATVSDSGTTAVADGAACGGGQERAAAVSRRLLVTQRLLAADSVNSRDSFIRWGWRCDCAMMGVTIVSSRGNALFPFCRFSTSHVDLKLMTDVTVHRKLLYFCLYKSAVASSFHEY